MERTKVEGKIRWQKKGGGSFRLDTGKIIKPNEIFYATESQIPKAFRFMIVPLDELPEPAPVVSVKSTYALEKVSTGWYNVVDSAGKVLNEKALRKPDAEKLLDSLQ